MSTARSQVPEELKWMELEPARVSLHSSSDLDWNRFSRTEKTGTPLM